MYGIQGFSVELTLREMQQQKIVSTFLQNVVFFDKFFHLR